MPSSPPVRTVLAVGAERRTRPGRRGRRPPGVGAGEVARRPGWPGRRAARRDRRPRPPSASSRSSRASPGRSRPSRRRPGRGRSCGSPGDDSTHEQSDRPRVISRSRACSRPNDVPIGVQDGEHRHGHQRRRHGTDRPGQRRVPPAPPPGPLRGPDPPRPDRPVGQEPPQVLGQLLGRRVALAPGPWRSP